MLRPMSKLLLLAIFALSTGTALAEETAPGTLAGTVFYQPDPQQPWRYARYYVADAKNGRLAEAVVCLTDRKLRGLRPPT
jgi:hypothetical protein